MCTASPGSVLTARSLMCARSDAAVGLMAVHFISTMGMVRAKQNPVRRRHLLRSRWRPRSGLLTFTAAAVTEAHASPLDEGLAVECPCPTRGSHTSQRSSIGLSAVTAPRPGKPQTCRILRCRPPGDANLQSVQPCCAAGWRRVGAMWDNPVHEPTATATVVVNPARIEPVRTWEARDGRREPERRGTPGWSLQPGGTGRAPSRVRWVRRAEPGRRTP